MSTALDVASYISARHEGYGPSNRRLQKLLYFAQAWSLAWTGHGLFDSDFEAWSEGPVEREVWKAQRYSVVPDYQGQLPESARDLIDSALTVYWELSDQQLVDLSHEEVWREARGALKPRASSRTELDREHVRRYYLALSANGEGPNRSVEAQPARDIESTAATIADRWREGLDLLAQK